MAVYKSITFDNRKKIAALYAKGMSISDISDEVGVALRTLYVELKRGATGNWIRTSDRPMIRYWRKEPTRKTFAVAAVVRKERRSRNDTGQSNQAETTPNPSGDQKDVSPGGGYCFLLCLGNNRRHRNRRGVPGRRNGQNLRPSVHWNRLRLCRWRLPKSYGKEVKT